MHRMTWCGCLWWGGVVLVFLGQLEQDLVLMFHHPPAQVHELDLLGGEHTGSQVITSW